MSWMCTLVKKKKKTPKRSTFYLFLFLKKIFAILLNWGFTVNSPDLSYVAWPSQAYKAHSTTSNSTLCEVFSEQRIIVT